MTFLLIDLRAIHTLRQLLAAGFASLVLLGAGAAWADPPARAGRIVEVAGTAWLFDPESKSWVRVQRNQTIGQGDQMRTDIRSRVGFRVGSSTVWIDEQSDIEVLQMDDMGLGLRLTVGDIALRLRTAQAAQETRIQTREGVISPETEGLFRIDQLDRGSRLAVLQGRAQFDSDPGAPVQRAWLREGEQAEFWRAESARMERQPLARDKFSAWFIGRDQGEASASVGLSPGEEPYVSPEMTGAEDLRQHGHWESAVEYGNVWIPTRVASGWAPYQDGNWVWTRQWGWSWVDNAPWGFAPFHYGRWVQHRGGWAWTPGRFELRPAYAPALVAWTGGSGVSIGITIGGVRRPPQTGWVPLAPRQIFVPTYPHSPQYIERFYWNKNALNRGLDRDSFDPNERKPKPASLPTPARGDAGPQPYLPVPAPAVVTVTPTYGNGNAGNPNTPWNRPSNANGGNSDYRAGNRWDRDNTAPQTPTPPVQSAQPALQQDNRDYRNNRNFREVRDNPEERNHERPQRNREPIQQSQQSLTLQPSLPYPSAQPQVQRTAQPPMAQPPALQQSQQAKPVDEEKPSGRRNKREAPDRDFR